MMKKSEDDPLDIPAYTPYSESFVSPEVYETYDMGKQVLDHLLFWKAIIAEEEGSTKINEYVDMVEKLQDGLHIPIRDPFNKAVAVSFELVIQNHLNPWNVDLMKFSKLYLERVKDEKEEVDFITAGKLMLMAWEILRRQSEDMVAKSMKREEPELDEWDAVDIAGDWYESDEDFDFTTKVKDMQTPPLEEKVWHVGDRKVTLIELVEAFDEARKEAEVRTILTEERKKERVRLAHMSRGKVKGMMHKEDLEADIDMTWKRLQNLEGVIPMCNVCNMKDREDMVTTLMSCLFLARTGKIRIWQNNFPFGDIFIKHITNGNNGKNGKKAS
jgi:segregation and condensation protein A